jgi:hypothetical protein
MTARSRTMQDVVIEDVLTADDVTSTKLFLGHEMLTQLLLSSSSRMCCCHGNSK